MSDEGRKKAEAAGKDLLARAEKQLSGDPTEALPRAFAAARSATKQAQEGKWDKMIPEAKAALKRDIDKSPSYADIAEKAGIKSPTALAAIQTAGDVLEPSGAPGGVGGTIRSAAQKAKNLIKAGNNVKLIDEVGRGGPIIQKVGDASKTPAAAAGRAQIAEQVAAHNKANPPAIQGARAKAQAQWAEQAAEQQANEAARRQFSPELAAATTREQLISIKSRMETFKKLFKMHNKGSR